MAYRILAVDDDAIQRDVLVHYLGLAGYEVEQAENGLLALREVLARVPDLVLLDIQMPEMDGFEVLRRMRESAVLRDVPVLLLSSLDRSHVKVRGLELGADDYITKPCSQPELLARVRAGLRRGARYRKNEHALSGDIEDIGLDTLLQTLQIGGRTVRIRLADVGAEIVVGRGAIHSCHYLRFSGMAAMQRVFLVGHGRFSANFDDAPASPHEQALAATHVIMESMVAVDDVRRALEGPLAASPVLDLGPAEEPSGALESVRSSLPMSAMELVVAMDADIRTNALLIAEAVRDGALRVVG